MEVQVVGFYAKPHIEPLFCRALRPSETFPHPKKALCLLNPELWPKASLEQPLGSPSNGAVCAIGPARILSSVATQWTRTVPRSAKSPRRDSFCKTYRLPKVTCRHLQKCGFLLVDSSTRRTGASAVSWRWWRASVTSLCFTVSSTVLTWASILMRRLSRQLWAVLSVLRSCVLVKLYKAVSCTSFWTSSRAALAAVSLRTSCCRLSRVRASLLPAESVSFFCRCGMSGMWTALHRVEPENSNECHASCTLTSLPATYYDPGKRTEGEKGGREKSNHQKS